MIAAPCCKWEEILVSAWLEGGSGFETEGVGFEPTEALTSLVFKTSAINHSTTPPAAGNVQRDRLVAVGSLRTPPIVPWPDAS